MQLQKVLHNALYSESLIPKLGYSLIIISRPIPTERIDKSIKEQDQFQTNSYTTIDQEKKITIYGTCKASMRDSRLGRNMILVRMHRRQRYVQRKEEEKKTWEEQGQRKLEKA